MLFFSNILYIFLQTRGRPSNPYQSAQISLFFRRLTIFLLFMKWPHQLLVVILPMIRFRNSLSSPWRRTFFVLLWNICAPNVPMATQGIGRGFLPNNGTNHGGTTKLIVIDNTLLIEIESSLRMRNVLRIDKRFWQIFKIYQTHK